MKKILHIAWNDVRLEFSSRWTLVFFLVLPLVFTAIVGSALSNMYGDSDPNGDTRFPLLVVDEDGGPLAAELGRILEASDVVRPVFEARDEAMQLFGQDLAPALLTIPAGLSERLLSGQPAELSLLKVPDDNRVFAIEQAASAAASQVSNAVAAALVSVAEREKLQPFETDAARQAYFQQALLLAGDILEEPLARVEATQAPEVTVEIASGFEQGSAGQLVTWVLITLIGAAEVFVGERLGGTLRRLVITPTSKAAILSGKVVGRLGMGIVQMILLIGFGALVFDVNWGRSPVALAAMVLAFALAAVGFGVMLGTFAKTRGQASGLTILFSMLTAALGGAWWPLEVTPPIYQTVVKVLPTTWAMLGFNDVIVRGQDLAGVLPEAGILLGFALVFFVVGIWRFRYE